MSLRAVAKEIDLKDRWENMGAQMVREVAGKTSMVEYNGGLTVHDGLHRSNADSIAASDRATFVLHRQRRRA